MTGSSAEPAPTSTATNNGSPTRPVEKRSSRARRMSLARGLHSIGRSLRRISLFGSKRPIHAIAAAEEKSLEYMLSQLSEDDLEIAARTSYNYLKKPQESLRTKYAEQFALRYLRSKKGDQEKALEKLKATIQFRREKDIDGLRLTFDDPDSKYREPLRKQLESKMLKVEGYDKEGRATYIFTPRNVQGHDAEWTIKEHIYTLERAIACSHAPDQTVNAVVDFNGFSPLRHAPPTDIGKEFMLTLRNHYAGSVNQIFLVDAPLTFNALWAIFKPFVGSKTRGKIHFVKSKHRKLERWYDKEQAGSWMMPGGTKNRELDVEEYLLRTRFNEAFDE